MWKSLLITLIFVSHAAGSECENSHGQNLPIQYGDFASKVIPTPPTSEDYSKKIRLGSPYEIITDLPAVSLGDINLLRNHHTFENVTVTRSKEGIWWTRGISGQTLQAPTTIQVRLETLLIRLRASVNSQRNREAHATIRIGTMPDESTRVFHFDRGVTFTVLDTWAGEGSYIARDGSPGAFQVDRNQAIILDNRPNSEALHAYPDSKDGIYESKRVLLRIERFKIALIFSTAIRK